jgi:hydroxymethylglutaryl-CoA synthase
MMFSYGSGCAASLFVLRFTAEYKAIGKIAQFKDRLASRKKYTPEAYDAVMQKREKNFGKAEFTPTVSTKRLI